MYSLCLASVCSQVCLLCSTHCWPDFLSCSHQSGIPREKREQTEARGRSFLQSRASVWKRHSVYCSSQPVESLSGGRSLWVEGKFGGHVDPRACLVRKEDKPNPTVNLQIFRVAALLTQQLAVKRFFFHEKEWREEHSGGRHQFWICLHDFVPTREEDAPALISHAAALQDAKGTRADPRNHGPVRNNLRENLRMGLWMLPHLKLTADSSKSWLTVWCFGCENKNAVMFTGKLQAWPSWAIAFIAESWFKWIFVHQWIK